MLGSKTLYSLAACGALLLSACGDNGMSGMGSTSNANAPAAACSSSNCAPAMITMTDAKGDFLSYTVNMTSLQLQTAAAGATVETLPATTKVDFAQLVDLTEVISAGQIPAAEYVSATLTLDYTGAKRQPPRPCRRHWLRLSCLPTTSYVGAAGLAALAALPANTMVAAFGALQTCTQNFTATTVLACTSVVTAMASGSVTVNLQSLDGLPVSAFNFAGTGTATASDANATAYVIDPGALSQTGIAVKAPARVDLTTLATPPTLMADANATNEIFAIGHRGKYKTENFNTFASFIAALTADLTPTATAVDLAATGQYDSTANTFTVNRLAVLIND